MKIAKEIIYSSAIIVFGVSVYSAIKTESYYVAGIYTFLILMILNDSKEKEQ